MGNAGDIAVVLLQVAVGVGSMVALLHFGVLILTRVAAGDLERRTPDQPLQYAFLVPCLDEESVIGATAERLLGLSPDVSVWVIDDGSTDQTAAVVRRLALDDERVRLIQRTLPNARQGKGPALNAGYRELVRDCHARGINSATVVVGVMDADGLLDRQALEAIDGLFGHPGVGAAQLDVRITNRRSLIGRLQDVEFFVFANLMQQGRNHVGSVGLGGNGQFTRLSALTSLGDAPWSDCLAEDLDLGLKLLTGGWRMTFTDRAAVHQQGLDDLRRLLRQRARWIQGHFQCWRHIPAIMRMSAPWYTTFDLVFHLIWPAFSCLFMPIGLVAIWVVIAFNTVGLDLGVREWITALLLGYALAFATSYALGFHYRAKARDISVGRTLVLVHLIGFYQFIWAAAGWWGLVRMLRRHRQWTKTDRLPVPAKTTTT